MKNSRLIIFDLDGTLIDAYSAIEKSFNYTMRKLKCPKQSAKTLRYAVGWGDKNLLRRFVKQRDLEEALAIYRQHHKFSLSKEARLLPGVKKTLFYLKQKGFKLAIASNRPTRFCLILLKSLKINELFDYVLCADKLQHIKPHPEIIFKILKRFKSPPEETIFVGDMAIDVQAAHRAKVRSFAIKGGSSKILELKKQKPDLLLNNINDLRKAVR